MNEPVVIVQNLSKKYCRDLKRSLIYGVSDMLKELTWRDGSNRTELRPKEFWASSNINFELKKGDCLGLIGRNGAGKSTLLKILNGLIKPDTGSVRIKGRVGALIELGAGFNPILTGRENVYINGAVLGFSKKEVDLIFDEIVAFAELEDFIDSPVQYYSSGMKVRLGFAVASQMKPDVLLIDEVLAVGDVGFKAKCYNEIFKVLKDTAVIFVSHSMSQVLKICNRVILLDQGKVKIDSEKVSTVVGMYYDLFGNGEKRIEGSGKIKLHSLKLTNALNSILLDQSLKANAEFFEWSNSQKNNLEVVFSSLSNETLSLSVLISFFNQEEQMVGQVNEPLPFTIKKAETKKFEAKLHGFFFNTGSYSMSIHFIESDESNSWGEIYFGSRSAIKIKGNKERFFGSAPNVFNTEWIDASDQEN